MRNRKRAERENIVDNQMVYQYYINRLTELAISVFEWQNLPASIDQRFLEMALFYDGKALFFEDEVMGHLCLKCAIGGSWNVYNIPTERRAYASNGYNNTLNDTNSVIIYNNYLHNNMVNDITMFAKRLYNLDRAIDVNVNAQKTPVGIICDENQRLTMKNLYMQFEGNEPFIFGGKNLDLNAIKTIRTDAPYVADNLYTLKTQIMNEVLTYLGISNVNTVKKERLISDEVTRELGGTMASRFSRLGIRKQACEQINAMFGLNIDVDYKEDFKVFSEENFKNALVGIDEGATSEAGDTL